MSRLGIRFAILVVTNTHSHRTSIPPPYRLPLSKSRDDSRIYLYPFHMRPTLGNFLSLNFFNHRNWSFFLVCTSYTTSTWADMSWDVPLLYLFAWQLEVSQPRYRVEDELSFFLYHRRRTIEHVLLIIRLFSHGWQAGVSPSSSIGSELSYYLHCEQSPQIIGINLFPSQHTVQSL